MTTSTDSAASFGNSHSPNGWPGFIPQTVPQPPYHAYVDPLDGVHHNPIQMGAGGGPEGPFTSLLHIATSGMVDEFGGPAVAYGGPYPPVPPSGHHPIFGDSRHIPAPHLCIPTHPEINAKPVGPNGKPKRKRIATVAQRRAANIRERRRMFNLNEAFDTLRARVPTFAYEKRLSRIETLRLAITYISFMGEVLNGKSPDDVKLNINKGLAWQVAQEEMAVVLSTNQRLHQPPSTT